MARLESHEFYCTSCGRKGIPVYRNTASQRGKGHLKKLWCIYEKAYYNHYECYTEEDVEKFYRKYQNGDFIRRDENYDNTQGNVWNTSFGQDKLRKSAR